MKILLLPFIILGKLAGLMIKLMGRLLGIVLGTTFIILGILISLTITGDFIGIPSLS